MGGVCVKVDDGVCWVVVRGVGSGVGRFIGYKIYSYVCDNSCEGVEL